MATNGDRLNDLAFINTGHSKAEQKSSL